MLPLEHSVKLLTRIKRQLVLKTNTGLYESGRSIQVLLYIIHRVDVKNCVYQDQLASLGAS